MKVSEAVRRARLELIETYGEEIVVWATYILYGDPTFEFATASGKIVVEPAASEPVYVEAPQTLRSEEMVKSQLTAQKSYSPFVYPLLGLFPIRVWLWRVLIVFWKTQTWPSAKLHSHPPRKRQIFLRQSLPIRKKPRRRQWQSP